MTMAELQRSLLPKPQYIYIAYSMSNNRHQISCGMSAFTGSNWHHDWIKG